VVRLRVDGRLHDVPFDEVVRARQIYHYTSADFARKERCAQAEAGEST
jgi:hypothetical protein